jgi:hypothetical protein
MPVLSKDFGPTAYANRLSGIPPACRSFDIPEFWAEIFPRCRFGKNFYDKLRMSHDLRIISIASVAGNENIGITGASPCFNSHIGTVRPTWTHRRRNTHDQFCRKLIMEAGSSNKPLNRSIAKQWDNIAIDEFVLFLLL